MTHQTKWNALGYLAKANGTDTKSWKRYGAALAAANRVGGILESGVAGQEALWYVRRGVDQAPAVSATYGPDFGGDHGYTDKENTMDWRTPAVQAAARRLAAMDQDQEEGRRLAKRKADLADAAPAVRAALEALLQRCDGPEGVQADGSNMDTREAHRALDLLGDHWGGDQTSLLGWPGRAEEMGYPGDSPQSYD